MTATLAGLYCPVTTPFAADGAPDAGRLAAQIARYATLPLTGIVLFGTSGEGPLLESAEEAPLLAAARAALPHGLELVVQVGRESARGASAAAARAADAGADALLCLPPRYYPSTAAGRAACFRAVAAATPLPLLAYHIPQRTHVELPVAELAALAREGVLRGVKDSAGDLMWQAALRQAAGPDFTILNGRAEVSAESLAAGADGLILAVADAAPERVAALLAAHRAGDAPGAAAAQAALAPLAACCGARYGVPGIKAALDARGWPGGGAPRLPLLALDGDGRAEVARALRAAGLDII